MKKEFAFLIFFCCLSLTIFCQQNYWQQQVNYKIDVSLNDSDNTLDGYVKMDYYNNSPDTLYFIWIQLWPNAYKNDRTAFSDQLLENGRTDFYFSNNEQRGYINRLDFKVNDITVKTEDHPLHQDIIKIILPQPLVPNTTMNIETPFHVKLPYNFNGNGYTKHSYQITQWYPKLEVYDRKGWHDIPYLSQGGSYNEFGNYEVRITVPVKYVVATNGLLKNDTLINTNEKIKTLYYEQNNITDFVWFADKKFLIKHDTIQTASGKTIDAFIYYKKNNADKWNRSMQFLKEAIAFKNNLIGEYPYNSINIVENSCEHNEAVTYPCIGLMKASGNKKTMDFLISHLTSFTWFGGCLANNERENLWMDKGFSIYYDDKYLEAKNETPLQLMNIKHNWLRNKLPDEPKKELVAAITKIKKDQPIETRTDSFSLSNYYLIGYFKSAEWLNFLQTKNVGTDKFNNAVKEYYQRWQFKHPYPEDFKKAIEEASNKNTDSSFALLNKKGNIYPVPAKKNIRFTFLFNLKETDKHNYISFSPALGYNNYDKIMVGAIIHNYQLPLPKLQFIMVPLYSIESQQLNGIGKISYSWYPDNHFEKIEVGVNGSRFSTNENFDTTGKKVFENFYKIVPSVRFYFNHAYRKKIVRWLDIRTYFIGEKQFNNFGVITGSDSSTFYPFTSMQTTRYINQLTFNNENNRVLYPYNYQLQLQQGKGFYRINATGNYFFNYAKGGGLKVRLFAAKFGLINGGDNNAYLYEPKLLAAGGTDDYTYSSYFIGRSASTSNPDAPTTPLPNHGIAEQQISTLNEGGLKLRQDLFGFLQGQSADWVAALNFNTTLPKKLFPFKDPLTFFFDIGTYAEAWESNPLTNKFLYIGGLQLSMFKNVLNIYVPFIFSSDFSNNFNSNPDESTFWKKVTFSIDMQNITLRKLAPQLSF